jgi:hypothetical protein
MDGLVVVAVLWFSCYILSAIVRQFGRILFCIAIFAIVFVAVRAAGGEAAAVLSSVLFVAFFVLKAVFNDIKAARAQTNKYVNVSTSLPMKLAIHEQSAYWQEDIYPILEYPILKPVNEKHYVYIIGDGKNYKIGIAKNPQNRLRQLQTGHALKLKIIRTFCLPSRDAVKTAEAKIHQDLRRYRLTGEWFSAPLSVIEKVVNKNLSIDQNSTKPWKLFRWQKGRDDGIDRHHSSGHLTHAT